MFEPSFLANALRDPDTRSGRDIRRSEIKLRLGVVTEIYPPNHQKNVSKRYVEYSVDVFVMEDAGTVKPYPAVMSDMFASASDKMSYTPRITKTNPSEYYITKGSVVAVLCVNADTQRALIIGGFPNPNLPVISDDPNADQGHHLSFEFNGISVKINKDGELLLLRKGATDESGTTIDGYLDNSGAELTVLKDGSLTVRSGTNTEVSINLNPSNGEINLTCKGNVNVDCGTGNGVVVNQGSHPMVRGDELLTALSSFITTLSSAVSSIPPAPPGAPSGVIGGAPAGALIAKAGADFAAKASKILSLANKVD